MATVNCGICGKCVEIDEHVCSIDKVTHMMATTAPIHIHTSMYRCDKCSYECKIYIADNPDIEGTKTPKPSKCPYSLVEDVVGAEWKFCY